jgi:16S rRNA processing protein RimM
VVDVPPSTDASTSDPGFPADAVEVGRIAGAWGVKGAFKVQPYSADPQALFSSRRWFLKPAELLAPRPAPQPGSAPAPGALPSLLKITQAREQAGGVVASAHEVADRSAADALRGARIFVSRTSFPTAGDGEFYWVDLIGVAVVNREGVVLGDVTGLLQTGPQCVLRVQAPGMAERLVPFVDAYVDEVDLPGRRIRVDWGLDY